MFGLWPNVTRYQDQWYLRSIKLDLASAGLMTSLLRVEIKTDETRSDVTFLWLQPTWTKSRVWPIPILGCILILIQLYIWYRYQWHIYMVSNRYLTNTYRYFLECRLISLIPKLIWCCWSLSNIITLYGYRYRYHVSVYWLLSGSGWTLTKRMYWIFPGAQTHFVTLEKIRKSYEFLASCAH